MLRIPRHMATSPLGNVRGTTHPPRREGFPLSRIPSRNPLMHSAYINRGLSVAHDRLIPPQVFSTLAFAILPLFLCFTLPSLDNRTMKLYLITVLGLLGLASSASAGPKPTRRGAKHVHRADLAASAKKHSANSVRGKMLGAAGDEDVKILSHNVFLFYKNIYPRWGQDHRAREIAKANFIDGHDVVIFQEMFEKSATNILQKDLKVKYPYQTAVTGRSKGDWDATSGNWCKLCPASGGVAVASKHKIVERRQHVFNQGCGWDYYANKGFAYVKIERNGRFMHVIATHTQADDDRCSGNKARDVRTTQFEEIRDYVKNLKIPKEEPIFIGGDMNVDKSSGEYASMLRILNAQPADSYKGWPSTYDPATNSIVKNRDPKSAPHYFDFVLVDKDHAVPKSAVQDALKVKPAPYTLAGEQYDDYSDHYPVAWTGAF
ncbi:uncharacterized protein VTP21DRAFT_4044 [Calcarisporiella thermophila]|uniref:uncharacterized protein n=1 Tax=Calcarisporiella thermophila TaxID=911321 RepID=UPI003742813E